MNCLKGLVHNCIAHPIWFMSEVNAVAWHYGSMNARRFVDLTEWFHDVTFPDD